jgi:hypothetical protein
MNFADQVLEFNKWLSITMLKMPKGVEILQPFKRKEVIRVNDEFYRTYFNDSKSRYMLLGINPGRLGAGITGIPFTDPVQLEKSCGIKNGFEAKGEISSEFVYEMIRSIGTVKSFYKRFYISSVCPLGFLSNGINLNYYDDSSLQQAMIPFMHESMLRQLNFGCRREVAFILGEGKNYKEFQKMNALHGYFEKLVSLPHPRFIMQYKRRKLKDYLKLYAEKLALAD